MHLFFVARRNILKCLPFIGLSFLSLLYLSYLYRRDFGDLLVWSPETEPEELPLPSYTNIFEMEKTLPQHNLDLPFPEGRTGRYVRFSTQIAGLGWNNVLNDVLLCSHLAWRSNRSYVFQNYIWKIEHFPWKVNSTPVTPLNALIAGPTAGGPWSANDPSPRAISNIWFNEACPEDEVVRIEASKTKDPVRGKDAKVVMDYWAKILGEHPSRCLDIVAGSGDGFPQTFDLWTVSTPLILPLWYEFKDSPVSRLLRPSPLVNRAILTNEQLFFPPHSTAAILRYEAMMALHIRRGDFEGSCQHLANWNSTFYMWNLLPSLPDPLRSGPVIGEPVMGENTPENYRLYKKRCMPSDDELVTKIMESKLDWETGAGQTTNIRPRERLSTLYISTNGEKEWVERFKQRMREEGWTTVVSSADLILDLEQRSASVAVDMDISNRAAVFIGNGWSSMTSNIVHKRLVEGSEYMSTRFW